MSNVRIAEVFDELATLLELAGDDAHRTRAYRRFAETARSLDEPIEQLVARGELGALTGVGDAIEAAVVELLERGSLRQLSTARSALPPGLPRLLSVPGLGATRVRKLWTTASVASLSDLVAACDDGRVAKIGGFGPKLAAKVGEAARAMLAVEGSVVLAAAQELARHLAEHFADAGARRMRIAGETRRGHEIVAELCVLVEGLGPAEIARVLASPELGPRHVSIEGPETVVATPAQPGRAAKVRAIAVHGGQMVESLLRETGSAAHVAALETLAASRGTSLGALASTADDEQAVYAALGIAFVPPELRDEASSEVPSTLLPARSLSGVFHVHTSWSDGTASIAAMARAAHEAGFGFVGISDHSQAAHYAGGLDRGRLLAQREEIARARREVPQIEILHGIEVDVLEDGRLDLDDDTLLTLDFVVASVHSHLGLAEEAQTARIVRAVSHPLVTILGHPTGRLLLGRPGYKFDLDVVARTAAAHGVALEINASPQRLDLGPELIRRAAAHGAQFCINPDAHEPRGFGDVPLGVIQARRAGLPTERVLNAMPRPALLAHLRDRRADAARALGRSIDPPAATSAEATA